MLETTSACSPKRAVPANYVSRMNDIVKLWKAKFAWAHTVECFFAQAAQSAIVKY